MSIPLLIGVVFPLVLSLLGTYQIFGDAFAWEQRQIALDNAAITIGRRDREMFHYLSSINRLLQTLHAAHHPLHLCAQNPYTAAACLEEDLALESVIRELHRGAYDASSMMWASSITEANVVIGALGAAFSEVERPSEVPIQSRTCSVCSLGSAWEIEGDASTSLRARSSIPMAVKVSWEGESLQKGKPWNYLITDHAEGAF